MAKKPDHSALLRQASRQLIHALDVPTWCRDVLGFSPYPYQEKLLRSVAPRVAVLQSRQTGKSFTIAALAAHALAFNPKALVVVCAQRQEQASELLKKVKGFLASAGEKLAREAETSIELRNGARCVCTPSTAAAVRGLSAPLLVCVDEASYVTPELTDALRPMMASSPRGRIVYLSSPAGRSGAFYEACHSPHWELHKVTWRDCPTITEDFIEREREERGDAYVMREYEASFADSECAFFGADLIEAAFNCDAEPLRLHLFT